MNWPEEPPGAGVGASIGATKDCNGFWSKGTRKVERDGQADGRKTRRECRNDLSKPRNTRPVGVVEPSVWTERMLTALETGIKGSKWYSLMDKVYARRI